jgi:ABC-type sugar transport system substrate-binding protein
MRPFSLAALVLAAALTGAVAPASASDRHPWCLVVQDWGDGWACGFDTFAQCQAEARAGNTGFCAANPAYRPPAPTKASRPRRQDR